MDDDRTDDALDGFLPIDSSDVERWVGVPVGGRQPKEPYSVNDIRRFVEALDNPHRLYWDDEYAVASPYGRIVAPQSYFGGGQGGTGPTPSIQGSIPNSHMLVGGDEHWFYGPRVFPGDRLRCDAMLFDCRRAHTAFAGPAVVSRGDTTYVNDHGEFVAKQRATSVRYLVENARRTDRFDAETEEPVWSAAQLAEVDRRKLEWVASFPGSTPRLWSSVDIGDEMTPRPIGPHSAQSFTSESRSEQGPASWGAMEPGYRLANSYVDAGWVAEMEEEPDRAAVDPGFADPLFRGPSRGHVQRDFAKVVGMPRAYGYGASVMAWVIDYLANWAGDRGFVLHHKTRYRNPVLSGDVTTMTGRVVGKWFDDAFERGVVQLAYEARSQTGAVTAEGVGEVDLPLRDDDFAPVMGDPRVRARYAKGV